MADIDLKNQLEKIDAEYQDQMYKMFGGTSLTYNKYTDSSRLYMFTSHLKQFLTLLNPDVPRLATGFENSFGSRNTSVYKQMKGTIEVKDIIYKFDKGEIFTMVLYDHDTDTYDMIETPIAENLTEKFGFGYNIDNMKKLKKGDIFYDEVLYRSTSFDENMNYRYGKNARVLLVNSNDTLEDAISIRKGWALSASYIDVDSIIVPINDNDLPLNIYGDNNEYKVIPDIGEMVKNSTICATRRINKNQIFYDFQSDNTRTIYSSDIDYFTEENAVVYDIDIYYNKEEPFPDNIFMHQIKGYYDQLKEYADKIYEWTTFIKNKSGSKYTNNVTFYRSKYKHYNDLQYKWTYRDKIFSNIFIEFKVKSVNILTQGSKLSGRYGNKGVISKINNDTPSETTMSVFDSIMGSSMSMSEKEMLLEHTKIVDDDKMPYCDDYKVDICLDLSALVRRLITEPLHEIEINFCAEQIQKKVKSLDNVDDKAELIFKFLKMVNEDEGIFFNHMYDGYTTKMEINNKTIEFIDVASKEAFVRDVEENGFYLVAPPDKPISHMMFEKIYEEFPFIKPIPIYIDLFGIKHRRIMRPAVIGWMYMIVLKHNTQKNTSVRSTFKLNRINQPVKEDSKKTNRSKFSHTPIRLSEYYVLMTSLSGKDLAEFNIFMRSSTLGRKSLKSILETKNDPMIVDKLEIKDNYINTNADNLNARLKTIGIKLKFIKEGDVYVKGSREEITVPIYFKNKTIYDTIINKPYYARLIAIYERYNLIRDDITKSDVLNPTEKELAIWDAVFEDSEVVSMKVPTEIKELIYSTIDENVQIKTIEEDTLEKILEPNENDSQILLENHSTKE